MHLLPKLSSAAGSRAHSCNRVRAYIQESSTLHLRVCLCVHVKSVCGLVQWVRLGKVCMCVCVCERERPGLMLCCQRARDDKVVKPQEDGEKKTRLSGRERKHSKMKKSQQIREKSFLLPKKNFPLTIKYDANKKSYIKIIILFLNYERDKRPRIKD